MKNTIEITDFTEVETHEFLHIWVTKSTSPQGEISYRTGFIPTQMVQEYSPYIYQNGENIESKVIKIKNPFKN